MFGPLSLSFAPYVKSSRTLLKWIKPIATWYTNAAGYRKYGFKYDDLRTFDIHSSFTHLLICEQLLRNAQMYRGYDCLLSNYAYKSSFRQALNRLTPQEKYDRAYRLKRASQASVLHAPLPREQWLKPEEVLSCHIRHMYKD